MPWNDFLQPLESIVDGWFIKGWNIYKMMFHFVHWLTATHAKRDVIFLPKPSCVFWKDYDELISFDLPPSIYFCFSRTHAIIIISVHNEAKGKKVKGLLNIVGKMVGTVTKLQVLRPYIAITKVMIWCLHHALVSVLAVDLWETGNYDICPAIASFRFIPVVLFCLAYCLSTNQAGGALNLAKL